MTTIFLAPTEAQVGYANALVARLNAKVVTGPKKPTRYNNPVKAHAYHMDCAAKDAAAMNAGQMNRGQVSAFIDSLKFWVG